MQETTRSPPTVLFTLRLWQESLGNERREWRGEIKNLSTQETRYFRMWEEIAVFIPQMLPDDEENPA